MLGSKESHPCATNRKICQLRPNMAWCRYNIITWWPVLKSSCNFPNMCQINQREATARFTMISCVLRVLLAKKNMTRTGERYFMIAMRQKCAILYDHGSQWRKDIKWVSYSRCVSEYEIYHWDPQPHSTRHLRDWLHWRLCDRLKVIQQTDGFWHAVGYMTDLRSYDRLTVTLQTSGDMAYWRLHDRLTVIWRIDCCLHTGGDMTYWRLYDRLTVIRQIDCYMTDWLLWQAGGYMTD